MVIFLGSLQGITGDYYEAAASDGATPWQCFRFGEVLLVAPVVEEAATSWDVYLPQGEWIDFWIGASVSGLRVLRYPVPKATIPVFIKSDRLDYSRGLVTVD